ncbi:MAG: tripartite tricarboxylate transporter TctB family protein [Oscillospiraceae bacterium]|nr:tripartite tricarboxylate transporter TctB family protein [Oscillospiraceae bacterium]
MEQKRRRINNDVFIGVGLMLVSGFFLWESMGLHPGAGRFPRVIFTLCLALSTLVTLFGVRKTLNPALTTKEDHALTFAGTKMPLVVFAMFVVYLLLINWIGFYIATCIFIPAFMFTFGARRIIPIVAITIAVNLFVYGVFERLLNVFLP